MRTKKALIRLTLAFALATGAVVAMGCGSDASPPAGGDAGTTADAGGADVDSGAHDAGGMVDGDAGSPADADAAAALAISPPTATATGCSVDTVTFTASGGTPPYTWSTSEGGTTNLTVKNATQADWTDGSDNFCGTGGTVTITVTDSVGASASAVITVIGG